MEEGADVEVARGRLAEQLMSDERILGAVPEDAARLLLDRALAALDATANAAADEAAFAQTGEAIRQAARAIADAAAEAEDPAAVIAAAQFPAMAPAPEPAEQPVTLVEAPSGLGEVSSAPLEAAGPWAELPSPDEPHSPEETPEQPASLWERLRGWWR